MTTDPGSSPATTGEAASGTRAVAVVALVVGGTGLGLAGTDLVLPAVPTLPAALHGSLEQAQLVIATYTGGTAVGLVLWGTLAQRWRPVRSLVASLAALAVLSFVAAAAGSMPTLLVVRGLQGVAAAAPAVLGPGVIRSSLGERGGMRGLAVLGSVEAIVPAAAPIVGAVLVSWLGWRGPLGALGVAAGLVALCLLVFRRAVPAGHGVTRGSYRALIARTDFLRLGASYALTLAGLLTFVLGAPAVIVGTMGGGIGDYLVMQVVNVAAFIVTANLSPRWGGRIGRPRLVLGGTVLATAGALGLLAYGLAGGATPTVLIPLMLPISIGLGLRGPAGLTLALDASHDDVRGSALIMLAVTTSAAVASAVVAALVSGGLVALAAVTTVVLLAASACAPVPRRSVAVDGPAA